MRVAAAVAILATGVAVAGCPKKKPPEVERPTPSDVTPTVARTWGEIDPEFYGEFMELADWGLTLTVGDLLERHDTDRWTRRDAVWGPPDMPVIEFIDTDRPTSDRSAIAGWVLAPAAERSGDELLPARRAGVSTSRPVRAVVLRDFIGAPEAPSPEDVVLVVGDVFPPPWTFCTPTAPEGTAVAYDTDRGLKLGLVRVESKDEGAWTVDHVEFLSPGFVAEEWWTAKGYGDCAAFAAMDVQGRVRKLRPR